MTSSDEIRSWYNLIKDIKRFHVNCTIEISNSFTREHKIVSVSNSRMTAESTFAFVTQDSHSASKEEWIRERSLEISSLVSQCTRSGMMEDADRPPDILQKLTGSGRVTSAFYRRTRPEEASFFMFFRGHVLRVPKAIKDTVEVIKDTVKLQKIPSMYNILQEVDTIM